MADTKDTSADSAPRFKHTAGWYTNGTPRVINITSKTVGEETVRFVPGQALELSDEQMQDKHLQHLIDHGELVKAESADEKAEREQAEKPQPKTAPASKAR